MEDKEYIISNKDNFSRCSTLHLMQRKRAVQRLGGGRGCHKFVPVLGGDGMKIAPSGDIFDQPPGEMS